jgi:arsenite methyltransferase
VLDLGCGRGALLTMVAELLPNGRAVGIDLWHPGQTGNSPEATALNAELEGVADRVEVRTGDVTRPPFADGFRPSGSGERPTRCFRPARHCRLCRSR